MRAWVRRWGSDRRLLTLAALAGLSFLVAAMVAVRVVYTDSGNYVNLVWNLFLAWVPLAFALVVYDGVQRGARRLPLIVCGVIWLLFFPNAPYLITDFKYLDIVDGAPIWYDAVLVSAAAWAGLALGFISLYLMHSVARRYLGSLNAWLAVGAVLALSSFGVFLGRFRRWNSWDLFVQPHSLLGDVARGVADPLAYPRALAVMIVFSAFLASTYLVFYAFARMTGGVGDESRSV
jgi:uncharacterized membrane protein